MPAQLTCQKLLIVRHFCVTCLLYLATNLVVTTMLSGLTTLVLINLIEQHTIITKTFAPLIRLDSNHVTSHILCFWLRWFLWQHVVFGLYDRVKEVLSDRFLLNPAKHALLESLVFKTLWPERWLVVSLNVVLVQLLWFELLGSLVACLSRICLLEARQRVLLCVIWKRLLEFLVILHRSRSNLWTITILELVQYGIILMGKLSYLLVNILLLLGYLLVNVLHA